jgi:hypothetical protein
MKRQNGRMYRLQLTWTFRGQILSETDNSLMLVGMVSLCSCLPHPITAFYMYTIVRYPECVFPSKVSN